MIGWSLSIETCHSISREWLIPYWGFGIGSITLYQRFDQLGSGPVFAPSLGIAILTLTKASVSFQVTYLTGTVNGSIFNNWQTALTFIAGG